MFHLLRPRAISRCSSLIVSLSPGSLIISYQKGCESKMHIPNACRLLQRNQRFSVLSQCIVVSQVDIVFFPLGIQDLQQRCLATPVAVKFCFKYTCRVPKRPLFIFGHPLLDQLITREGLADFDFRLQPRGLPIFFPPVRW